MEIWWTQACSIVAQTFSPLLFHPPPPSSPPSFTTPFSLPLLHHPSFTTLPSRPLPHYLSFAIPLPTPSFNPIFQPPLSSPSFTPLLHYPPFTTPPSPPLPHYPSLTTPPSLPLFHHHCSFHLFIPPPIYSFSFFHLSTFFRLTPIHPLFQGSTLSAIHQLTLFTPFSTHPFHSFYPFCQISPYPTHLTFLY